MPFLRKYATGTGADIYITMVKRAVVDHAVGADWTPAAGDVKVSIDGAAAANIGTLPTAVAMGNSAEWKFVFTNAELTGKVVVVTIADSATKAVEDNAFVIETYGNASALHPFDLGTASTAQTGDSFAIVNSGTHGNAALKTLIDAVDNFVDTEIASIITTLGTPAGVSISADILVIDNLVDDLESRLTAARAGYLDNINNATLATAVFPTDPADQSLVIAATDAVMARLGAPAGASIAADIATRATPAQVNTEADTALSDAGVTLARQAKLDEVTAARMAELDAANLPADIDQLKADNPNRPARGVALADLMFMMVDATDLNTPETGVTVTATISKDGGPFAACTNAASEVSGGWYKITLTATELTADSIALKFTGTGCAQRNIAFRTQPT